MRFAWNLAAIQREYRVCCRLHGRRPRRLVHPPRRGHADGHLRIVRPAGPPLPPDVLNAIVDALVRALLSDVRGGGGRDGGEII